MDDLLDLANQLMADRRYAQAAAAYEDFLRAYPASSQSEQVTLVLGLIYSQYLPQPQRAIELFRGVLGRLHDARQKAFAEAELARLEAPPPP
jgi:outer membrane protein assembly factor BamD (BamD/ComL family)